MNFQPSELAKLAIALYAANYMVRRMDARENFFRAVTPMVVAVAFVGVLLLRQPDMGAFIVIATIATLFFVPVVFSLLRHHSPTIKTSEDFDAAIQ